MAKRTTRNRRTTRRAHRTNFVPLWITLACVFVMALVCFITNPKEAVHKEKISNVMSASLTEYSCETQEQGKVSGLITGLLVSTIANPVANAMVNTGCEYHDYGVFSTMTLRDNTVTFGFLGRVFPKNRDKVKEILKEELNR